MTKSANMPVGRPLKFTSVKDLEDKVNAYFASCYDPDGKIIKPITYSGLAVALDTTRQTLLNYKEKDEYLDTLTRAKAVCEEFAESQLFIGKNPSGAQFSLVNNYDSWANKHDVNHGGQANNPVVTLSADDRTALDHYFKTRGIEDARPKE